MLDNKVYDVMMQIVQESKSLHHIKKYYCKDAEGDKVCDDVWDELIRDKEAHITKLVGILKKYI